MKLTIFLLSTLLLSIHHAHGCSDKFIGPFSALLLSIHYAHGCSDKFIGPFDDLNKQAATTNKLIPVSSYFTAVQGLINLIDTEIAELKVNLKGVPEDSITRCFFTAAVAQQDFEGIEEHRVKAPKELVPGGLILIATDNANDKAPKLTQILIDAGYSLTAPFFPERGTEITSFEIIIENARKAHADKKSALERDWLAVFQKAITKVNDKVITKINAKDLLFKSLFRTIALPYKPAAQLLIQADTPHGIRQLRMFTYLMENKEVAFLETLIKSNGNVNLKDSRSYSLLEIAVNGNLSAIAQLLIKAKAAVDSSRPIILMIIENAFYAKAAHNNKLEQEWLTILKGALAASSHVNLDCNPLCFATQFNYKPAIDLLLEKEMPEPLGKRVRSKVKKHCDLL